MPLKSFFESPMDCLANLLSHSFNSAVLVIPCFLSSIKRDFSTSTFRFSFDRVKTQIAQISDPLSSIVSVPSLPNFTSKVNIKFPYIPLELMMLNLLSGEVTLQSLLNASNYSIIVRFLIEL
jgi:hypothetical protein